MTLSTPLVSVCCFTYNQEKFIRQAVDSFLMQQTSFPIEIIIHDDASTDNTTNIVREYQEKYPHIIKLILQTENQYSLRRFGFLSDLFNEAKGKYIALCEGDDYWTDTLKLQKQVDFLEANPNFAICFHQVKIWEEGELKDDYITCVPSNISTIVDLAKGNYIHTPSCVFRNNISKILGSNFSSSPLGDYYIHIMNAQYGNIFCIEEVMAVYRVHRNSIWSSKNQTYKIAKTLKAIEAIVQDLQKQFVEARLYLIDQHIHWTMNIYDQTLEIIESENAIYNSHEYVLRLLKHSVSLEKRIENLKDDLKKYNSIKLLTITLAKRIKHFTTESIKIKAISLLKSSKY